MRSHDAVRQASASGSAGPPDPVRGSSAAGWGASTHRGVYGVWSFFFFQAEDGIRDLTVTGVQTCALPILFRRFPEHPGLAHYIIHADDSPQLAALGLDAARRYARIAPSAPHAQHMPSHIFVRLGLWDETIAANQRSLDAGIEYARAQGRSVAPEQFHALDYMVYGYLQEGRDSAARRTVEQGLALTAVLASDLVTNYNRVAMEARVPLERGDWAAAARLPVRAAGQGGIGEALAHFARGIGAARSNDAAEARVEVTALGAIQTALAGQPGYNWSRIVGIKQQAVAAWSLLAAGDTAGALREAKAAADLEDVTEKHPVTPGELLPARELEGDLLLAVGRYPSARAAYEATLRRAPGRPRSLFGVARAAELAGDVAAAPTGHRAELAGEPLHFEPFADGFRALGAVPFGAQDSAAAYLVVQRAGVADDSLLATLPIARRRVPRERLRVAPQYAEPPESLAERIRLEQEMVREVRQRAHQTPRLWQGPVLRPRPAAAASDV